MIKALKKKFLPRYIIRSICFIFIGYALCMYAEDGIMAFFKPTVNLNDLTVEQFKTPIRVEGDITCVMDYYAYTSDTYKDEDITREYLIPVGNEAYIGLYADKSYLDALNNNMDATTDYLNGTDNALSRIKPVSVSGTIIKMENDSLDFYNRYLSNLSYDEKEFFLPYILKIDCIGRFEIYEFYFILIAIGAFWIFAIIWLIRGLTGSYLKPIKKYCAASGCPEAAMMEIEQFFESTPEVNEIRLSPEFLMVTVGSKLHLIPTSSILWIYQHVTKEYLNFIRIGKSHEIVVNTTDGSFSFSVKNEKKAEEILKYFRSSMPYLILGYNKELKKIYNHKRLEMIRIVEERKNSLLSSSKS